MIKHDEQLTRLYD